MTKQDKDYAVAFSIQADHKGVKLVVRPAIHHKRIKLSAPFVEFGDAESFTIFDDVFIPNKRIFMNAHNDARETPYAGFLALLFAHYHRHSYTSCKPAMCEILASTSALVAEYNGIEKTKHVQDKLSHLIGTAELVYTAGESSAFHGEKSASRTYIPDKILTNAGRRLAGE